MDELSKNLDKGLENKPDVKKESQNSLLDDKQSTELKEKAHELIEGVSEMAESSEVSEFIDQKVSEKSTEGKKKASGVGFRTDDKSGGKKIMGSIPRVEVMRIQIATKVKKEIIALEKEAKNILRSPGKMEPFQLTLVVAKIRRLRELLASLAYATKETLMKLWEQYVKGTSS